MQKGWYTTAFLIVLVALSIARGVTTPAQLNANQRLRAAEAYGDHLFHSPSLGANHRSCDSCHIDGGRFSHRLGSRRIPSLIGAKTQFPLVQANGHVETLEAEINACLVHFMRGQPLPPTSRRLAVLDLYIRHLSRFHER
ncbi:MAG: hypothetical protein OWU33_12645 [Firmicutes bacterium]|nr:hypothetical protein [Bacillota bacterium]